MNILIVNTYDKGGAANACFRLHLGLLDEGVSSNALVLNKSKNYKSTYKLKSKRIFFFSRVIDYSLKKLKRISFFNHLLISPNELFLMNRTKGLEMFSFPNSRYDITENELYKNADIVNLHWVAGLIDYESFFKKNTKPVVWTLHDMNPFTGGEHYEESYLGISDNGIPLSRVINLNEKKVFEKNLSLKMNAIKNVKNLTIVSPSNWLLSKAKNSSLFKNRSFQLIPYGLNTSVFKPRNKTFAKDFLGIAERSKVILFVADYIDNNRKGFSILKNALEKNNISNVLLCSIGKGEPKLEGICNILHLGTIYDEKMMSLVYSAADVFVIPSLIDNLPNTVLESLLCGTPVIGFSTGGIPEMIEHGKNGLLAKSISSKSLSTAIQYFFNSGVQLSRNEIRENAVSKYDAKIQVRNYLKLFNKISKDSTE